MKGILSAITGGLLVLLVGCSVPGDGDIDSEAPTEDIGASMDAAEVPDEITPDSVAAAYLCEDLPPSVTVGSGVEEFRCDSSVNEPPVVILSADKPADLEAWLMAGSLSLSLGTVVYNTDNLVAYLPDAEYVRNIALDELFEQSDFSWRQYASSNWYEGFPDSELGYTSNFYLAFTDTTEPTGSPGRLAIFGTDDIIEPVAHWDTSYEGLEPFAVWMGPSSLESMHEETLVGTFYWYGTIFTVEFAYEVYGVWY